MIFLCAQPDIPYYHWQVETVIYNFTRLGIKPEHLHFIFSTANPSPGLQTLMVRYPVCNFHCYPDTRVDKSYISSIRPNIIGQHYLKYPELEKQAVFYHDCDIIFRELPDFERMLEDKIWYLSDTNSYINADYVKSKGVEIFQRMCEIVGVESHKIESINRNSGGAQYLMKGVNFSFWDKVERDSNELYKYMTSSIPWFTKKFEAENPPPPDKPELQLRYHPIQAWCADMWAVLWNAIYFGHEVKVDDALKFSWATSSIGEYEKCPIFHNAGVTPSLHNFRELFFKGEFQQKSPFNWDLSYVSDKNASFYYVQEILAAKKFITENFSM